MKRAYTEISHRLQTFLFEPISPLPIMYFRSGVGFLSLLNFLSLWPDRATWFTEIGVLSNSSRAIATNWSSLNLFNWIPNSEENVSALLMASIIVSFLVTLNWKPRWTCIALYVLTNSFHHQNSVILQGGDTLMRVCTFFLMFAPQGPARSAPWVQRILQWQICLVYFSTFLWKMKGSMWIDGTATYFTSRLIDFHRFTPEIIFDHMPFIRLLTWGTLYTELLLGTLLWFKPTRKILLVIGVFFHVGIELTMNIPIFEWIMLLSLILFVDGEELETLVKRVAQSVQIVKHKVWTSRKPSF